MFDKYIKEPFFTDTDRENYFRYKELADSRLAGIAEQYMTRKISILEALPVLHEMDMPGVGEYTRDLLFVFACTPYLEKTYEDAGLSKEIFTCFLQDIKYKMDECYRVKGVFGTFVVTWYNVFFEYRRVALGRLQFDMAKYEEEPITVGEYTLDRGDFFLRCHIPSGGPLRADLCKASLDKAYALFYDRLKDGILPITLRTWLLYPPYAAVFGEKSNTVDFGKNFKLLKTRRLDTFEDAWRVFGTDRYDNLSVLPASTTLQKNFIDYIRSGKPFGDGMGILLYNGEKILTRTK